MTGTVPDWVRQSMRKGAADTCDYGVKENGSLFHSTPTTRDSTRNAVRMADGGSVSEAEMKQRGLESSKDEKVGFLDRLRMGNIDDPNSEAYKRFGAGRAKMDAELDRASKEADDLRSSLAARKAKDDADFDAVDKSFQAARAVSGSGMSFSEKTRARNAAGASGEKVTVSPVPVAKTKPMEPVGRGVRTKITNTGDETARLARRNPVATARNVAAGNKAVDDALRKGPYERTPEEVALLERSGYNMQRRKIPEGSFIDRLDKMLKK